MIHPRNMRSLRVAQRLGLRAIRKDLLLGDPVIVYAGTRVDLDVE